MSTASVTTAPTSDTVRNTLATAPSEWQRWIVVPPACLLLAALCLLIDLPVARFCQARHVPKFLVDFLKNAETFGHSAGVTLIVLTVLVLDPHGRWRAGTAALCALAGGLGANVLKLCIGRYRPGSIDLQAADVSATFISWLPLGAGGSGHQSFPSAHTGTAVGLAVALSAFYPRGRVWFGVLALLVGLQRIETSAHYPSDVCVGAAVGWIGAQFVLMLRQPKST